MSEPVTGFSDIILTPHGLLRMETAATTSVWPDPDPARRIDAALDEGAGPALALLETKELNSALPPAATWWRELARRYFTELCHLPELEPARFQEPTTAPPEPDLLALIESAPPLGGGEYLSLDVLRGLWTQLDEHVRAQIAAHPQGASAWLRESHPLWRMVGRVSFHLAENKNHPTHPFAFMASYASRISNQARVQHLPLGRALQEYAGAKNKSVLLNLLSPIQKAAEKNPWVKTLVDSGRVFRPLLWSAADAYQFLKNVPACEESGLLVRLPDWWKGGRPPRPRVKVRIGQQRPAGLGVDTLLDFSAETTLDGEPLTDEEWQQLLNATESLVLIRGKWVEVDAEKLKEALAHWKKVERMAKDGLSFFEGMRLISGLRLSPDKSPADATVEPEANWTGVQPGQWLDEVLSELRDPIRLADAEPIPGLEAQLRPYQTVGVSWLWFLSRLGLGGCLADDMGLGKTIQVLALLLKRKAVASGKRRPSLLVAPASLLANWRAEINRFTPSVAHQIAHPSEWDDSSPSAALASVDRQDLVITTYGMVARLKELREIQWDLVILDEAQAIKNAETRQARAVKELKGHGRFALTGTPVENRAGDLWSIFDFLNPGLLGSAAEFTRYIRARDTEDRPDYGPLRNLTRPYILRRLKTDKRVISDLPDKTEVRAWCSLTKTQAALYESSVAALAEGLEKADGIQRRGLVLAFIMRFKQICNHPSHWLKDGAFAPELSGKFARLRELAEEIAARQEKVLVFTQFREITDPLLNFLSGIFSRPGLVLHGGVNVAERRKVVDSFQRDDGPPFFILTVKAGGSGLNLTQAAQVIHFDRWWNPAVENQATDRAFRIGQKQNVLVHKFVCRGTIEERIDKVIEEKQSLSANLLEGGGEKLLTEMKNDELVRFVALDLKRAVDA